MSRLLRLQLCESLRLEVGRILDELACGDVQLASYPSCASGGSPGCAREHLPPASRSALDLVLIGGSCAAIRELDLPPGASDIPAPGDCGSLVCPREIYQPWVDRRYWIATPGWLAAWHRAGSPILARSARGLLLLDTGIDPAAGVYAADFAARHGFPHESLFVGLSHLRLLVSERIAQWRLEKQDAPAAGQLPSDYAIALELLSDLPLARTEEVLANRMFHIARVLFGASSMHYLSIVDDQPGELWSMPSGSAISDETRERLRTFTGAARPLPDGDGFLLRMGLDPRLGVVEFQGIPNSSQLPHFMQLTFVIGRVVAYAIQSLRNARANQLISTELAQERDLLRILLDNIPDSIYFKDRQSRFTRINKAQARLLGLGHEDEAVGRTDFDFLKPAFASEAYADEQSLMSTGTPLLAKLEQVASHNHSRWMTATKVPVFDFTGGVTGLVGISRDITDWKESQDALRRSDESLRLLFDTIPHAVFVFDASSLAFLFVNRTAVSHYGYEPEAFLRMTYPEVHAEMERSRLSASLSGLDQGGPPSGVWRHLTSAGVQLEVEVAARLFDFHGQPAVLAISQDVSERKRMQAELQQAQKLEAVGSLAAGIAHEINTPIQYVGDSVHFLKEVFDGLSTIIPLYQAVTAAQGESGPSDLTRQIAGVSDEIDLPFLLANVPDSFDRCLDGIDRVSRIVRAMKSFAHPGQLEARPADINSAVQNTLIIARNEYKLVAEVVAEYGDLPPVHCQIGDLNQVFLNLIVNAAHAIAHVVGSGGERGTISVRTSVEGPRVCIEIGDTGCGIPESIRERVFDPFFTTKEVGKGTGQGLAIARSVVVDRHGGTLSFSSEPGQGTRFFIHLPIGGRAALPGVAGPAWDSETPEPARQP